MELPRLNFSETYDFNIRRDKDKFFIYDAPRRAWLLLTPEEWVRQHWIRYFLAQGYAASALITEKKLVLNGLTKRIDLLVTAKALPMILVECKAPQIRLTQKTFEQTARYNSILGAGEIILSNGISHISGALGEAGYTFFDRKY